MPAIDGTSGDDDLRGTEGVDIIRGFGETTAFRDIGGGDDQLFGGDGDDALTVERHNYPAGRVLLEREAGADTIRFIGSAADEGVVRGGMATT